MLIKGVFVTTYYIWSSLIKEGLEKARINCFGRDGGRWNGQSVTPMTKRSGVESPMTLYEHFWKYLCTSTISMTYLPTLMKSSISTPPITNDCHTQFLKQNITPHLSRPECDLTSTAAVHPHHHRPRPLPRSLQGVGQLEGALRMYLGAYAPLLLLSHDLRTTIISRPSRCPCTPAAVAAAAKTSTWTFIRTQITLPSLWVCTSCSPLT